MSGPYFELELAAFAARRFECGFSATLDVEASRRRPPRRLSSSPSSAGTLPLSPASAAPVGSFGSAAALGGDAGANPSPTTLRDIVN